MRSPFRGRQRSIAVAPGFDSFPSPASWANWFRSNDLDEVRATIARTDGEHSRVVHDAGPLGFGLAYLRGATASVGWGSVARETTVRGTAARPLLHLQIPPGTAYRIGRSEIMPGHLTAVFIAPGCEFTRRSPAGRVLALALAEESLTEEVAARLGGGGSEVLLRTRALALEGIAESRLANALRAYLEASAPAQDTLWQQRGEVQLVATIADVLLLQSAFVRARPNATARVADLEGWIDAHLETPITVGKLCAVAGVGERALQKIFESNRGMSPMRFVAERRLARAHRLLSRASPNDDVTSIALRLGFGHLGRFSLLYRRTFGELPSQSLRRRQGPSPLASP